MVCRFKGLARNPEQQHCPGSKAAPSGGRGEGRELRDLPVPHGHPCPYPGRGTHKHIDAEGPRNLCASPPGGLCGVNRGAHCWQSCAQGTAQQTLAAPVAEWPLGSHGCSFTWQSAAGARSWLGKFSARFWLE